MTLCLFTENTLHKLSKLSPCLERETAGETDLQKNKGINQEAWLNGPHQHLLGISCTLRYCDSNYFLFIQNLGKRRLYCSSSYFSRVAQCKQRQNLYPVCWVRSPHTSSLSHFLSIFNVSSSAFLLKKHSQLQDTFLSFEQANLAAFQDFSF